MKVIEQSCEWMQAPPSDTLQLIERAGRTCYKSEEKITSDSAAGFVKRIMQSHHESVIEHVSASMLFITDRGVTHEIVRHRIASFSQESTRYCAYNKGKFGGEITVVKPVFWDDFSQDYACWYAAMQSAENEYMGLMDRPGITAQMARSVLPNSLKTEIVMTANMREWRMVFKLRCSKAAHPQMQDLAKCALKMFHLAVPVLFDDLAAEYL